MGKYYLLSLAVILFDQIIKVVVKLNMVVNGEPIHVIGDLFKIQFVENPGAAFGLTLQNFFPSLSETSAKVILTVFSFFAVFVIIYILRKSVETRTRLPWLVALILGGAIGNIIDRMMYGMFFSSINEYEGGFLFGRVVDMFYLDIWRGYLPDWIPIFGGDYYALWPIFNLADSAIFVGVLAIFIFQGRFFAKNEPDTDKASPDAENHPIDPAKEAPVDTQADTAG